MALIRVRNWARHFEISQSAKVKGPLAWVAVPTRHDGKGLRRILARPNGEAIYGAWNLILQVAAKCKTRGTLADEDGPLTANDLSLKTGGRECVFIEAIEVLSSSGIRWLEVDQQTTAVDCSSLETTVLPLQDKTEQDITLQDKTNPLTPKGEVSESDATGSKRRKKQITTPIAVEHLDFPNELNTLEVRHAAGDWLAYKRKRRQAYSDASHMNLKLKEFADVGAAAFIAAVNHSIGNNYAGIFKTKEPHGRTRNHIGPGQRFEPSTEPDPTIGKL